jgi:hypothetical protein
MSLKEMRLKEAKLVGIMCKALERPRTNTKTERGENEETIKERDIGLDNYWGGEKGDKRQQ